MGPWSSEEINRARNVPLLRVLDYLGAYYKRDKSYVPRCSSGGSFRVQVNFEGRESRFIFTGEKWIDELLPKGNPSRGGGGAIDFVRYVTGCGLVHAVKICLDAEARNSGGRLG